MALSGFESGRYATEVKGAASRKIASTINCHKISEWARGPGEKSTKVTKYCTTPVDMHRALHSRGKCRASLRSSHKGPHQILIRTPEVRSNRNLCPRQRHSVHRAASRTCRRQILRKRPQRPGIFHTSEKSVPASRRALQCLYTGIECNLVTSSSGQMATPQSPAPVNRHR